MLHRSATMRVFVARGATDMRPSFDRLADEVQTVLKQDPFSAHVVCFFSRRCDRGERMARRRPQKDKAAEAAKATTPTGPRPSMSAGLTELVDKHRAEPEAEL